MKSIVFLFIALVSICAYSQTVYVDPICKEECSKCSKNGNVMKVTYKVDKKTNKIFRTIEDRNPVVMADCTIIDENNWVCPGFTPYSEYGKQYAVNGVAHWNDAEPNLELDKKSGNRYSCRYEKSLFGGYKVIEELKRY